MQKAAAAQLVIAMTAVQSSSQISAYGYDAGSKTLAVQFKGKDSNPIYHYPNVPAKVYQGMVEAESKGAYLAKQVKPSYTGVKQPEPEAPKADTSRDEPTVAPAPQVQRAPWPFPVSST